MLSLFSFEVRGITYKEETFKKLIIFFDNSLHFYIGKPIMGHIALCTERKLHKLIWNIGRDFTNINCDLDC